MATANKYGKMARSMKATGGLTRPVGKESFGTLMAIFSRGNGLMTKLMVTVSMSIRMVPAMKENGKMISNMDSEKKFGQITVNMRATTPKEKNTAKASTFGKMAPCTMETGVKIGSKDTENINGKTVVSISENGKIITCMERAFILGQTEDVMRVNTRWTRSTALACTSGPMAECTKATGSTENNTGEESMCSKMELSK